MLRGSIGDLALDGLIYRHGRAFEAKVSKLLKEMPDCENPERHVMQSMIAAEAAMARRKKEKAGG